MNRPFLVQILNKHETNSLPFIIIALLYVCAIESEALGRANTAWRQSLLQLLKYGNRPKVSSIIAAVH